jgi:hypothetical protein
VVGGMGGTATASKTHSPGLCCWKETTESHTAGLSKPNPVQLLPFLHQLVSRRRVVFTAGHLVRSARSERVIAEGHSGVM